MLARAGKILVIAALVLTTGAHWAALQTVAWTAMLANNLRTQPLAEAVADTFDGEHPCPLCKAIAAGKKTEKEAEAIAPVLKLEFPPAAEKPALFPPAQFALLPLVDSAAKSFPTKPPLPPPRSLCA